MHIFLSRAQAFGRIQRRLRQRGFTLIELLVVIGMLAILSTIVLVAVNPLRQFAQARNTERQNDVAVILNAISERIADNGGVFLPAVAVPGDNCAIDLPVSAENIDKGTLNLWPCLAPTYLSQLPHDPSNGFTTCSTGDCSTNQDNYDLGYTVMRDPSTDRVTVCAPSAAESAIPGSQPFCLTR